jgi:hypothetical protein
MGVQTSSVIQGALLRHSPKVQRWRTWGLGNRETEISSPHIGANYVASPLSCEPICKTGPRPHVDICGLRADMGLRGNQCVGARVDVQKFAARNHTQLR